MEELLELKQLLLQGDIKGSLALVEDLEEMGRKAIIDKIRSYTIIVLLHLIKQQAENRTTKSWDVSIRNSIREIMNVNKRCKAGGYYVPLKELKEILVAAYANALDLASLEKEQLINQLVKNGDADLTLMSSQPPQLLKNIYC